MQSDDDDQSSSSSQSSHSSSSSPAAPTLTVNRTGGDDVSDSDSDNSKSSKSPKRGQDSDEDSGSGSDDDNAEKRPPSSSAMSSDNDDERGRTSDQDENGNDASSRGSRSRSASRSSGRSRSSEHSDSDREDVKPRSGNLKRPWEGDPDFYGIRRSSRVRVGSRIKPPKLVAQVQKKSPPNKLLSKKRKLSSDGGDSSEEEISRSVRKRGSAICYKENESEDDEMSLDENEGEEIQNGEVEAEEHFETIERIMDIRDGKKGATGSGTTIYSVEKNGDPNLTLSVDAEIEKQFLIKWVGWSHLHNTWESLDTLQELKAKGLKKLDNYCKKEDELSRWKSLASPEDIEYFECQLELQQELAKCYINVERIISENKSDDGQIEYFVKWDCLPYSEATWESGSLIQHRSPEVIEIFKKRELSQRTPATNAKTLRTRPKFVPVKTQPDYMSGDAGNLVLRDYQLDGVNWLVHSWCKENSVILADEMGLGKTIQTICLLSYLFETHNLYGPYLLVVPLSTMAAWQREFAQWAPQINVVTYLGDISSRDIIRDHEWFFKSNGRIKFNAVLTTYEIVLKDKAFLSSLSWAILMVDEAHRLKNGDSLLYKSLQEFETYHRLLITGTPLQNSLKELWSLLHFIMPNKFDDWEYFEKEHDHAAAKGYSKLHRQLEPFILRRVKKDVEKSLPSKVEQILRVEMTTLQKQYYKWILTKNYTALRKGIKGSVSSFINVVMELKKCCNHATLVKPIENLSGDTVTQLIKGSGKLMLLDKLLVRLKETGHRVLIFSQMVRMLDIIAEYLQLRRFSFQRLDGSIKGDLRKQALDHFNAEGSSDFCFLLSTRAGGLGINLATADTVIIFDSDWNPQNDLQAQARAHRIGQKNQVNIYRFVTKNSVEEDIVERAKKKMVLDHLVIQRMDTTGRTVLDKGSKSGTPFNKDELTAILKFGAEELFKEEDNEGEDQCDIDEILRRAETHEDPGERPGDELLSAFKVASFTVAEEDEEQIPASVPRDWEQIIPEDVRKQIEAEEKEKEMADLFLPPRSSRNAGVVGPVDNGVGTNTKDALKKVTRKRKRGQSDESESEDDGTAKKKKRGRPKGHKEGGGVKGFTNAQIKRFIKSLKRFPKPLLRLETIAKDAELTEKSFADLKKLGESLLKGCKAAMLDAKKNPGLLNPTKEDSNLDDTASGAIDGKKKREKGPIFNFAGTSINARTFSIALDELEPLGEAIPKDPEARKNWKFELKAKVPQFDVEWGLEEDTQLLLAVWEFGTAAWDKIRESSPLLKEKIFLEGDKKPLIKHAQSRADHLIKVIKKDLALTQRQNPGGKIKKKREKKEKGIDGGSGTATDGKTEGIKEEGDSKEKKPRVRKPKKAKDSGPMHFTANSIPTSLNVLGGLEPSVFNECKEKMRPVKKALKSLDNPDPNISEKEQIRQTRISLLQIGDQIQALLLTYKDKEQMKLWKSHLWYFVSNFTEYDSNDLYKLYKKAARKAEDKGERSKTKREKGKAKNDKTKSKSQKGKTKVDSDIEGKGKSGRDRSPPKHQYRDKDKDKDKDRERNKKKKESQRGKDLDLLENSSSAQVEHDILGSKSSKGIYYERDRDRERDRERERFAYSCGENVLSTVPTGTGSTFDSSSSYGSSQFSPQKYRNGPSTFSPSGFEGPSPRSQQTDSHFHHNHNSNSYRDRDQRERAPGDPRDRTGVHANKNYYNNNNNFDRDRGAVSERGAGFTGRPWGTSKNRWGSSHYGGPRRDDSSSNYYGSGSTSSSAFSDGHGRGQGTYRGRGSSTAPSYNNSGRIAPPLLDNHQRQWRRGDPPESEPPPLISTNGL